MTPCILSYIELSYRKELERHGIKSLETPQSKDVDLTLPKLRGNTIEDHFHNIAKEQAEPYQKLISSIVTATLPEMPKVSSSKHSQRLLF